MVDGSGDDTGPQTQAMPTQPPQQPSSGWVLAGRYRVVGRLGSGGMAQVFRARDDLLHRDVAVKVFRTPVDEPGNASSIERRGVEVQALARLSHPHLTALYDGSLADAHPAYLVMEFVDGPDLATRLQDQPLTYTEARLVGAQIAGALDYIHARGMVHRDVKPANILLGHDGDTAVVDGLRARLSDFGIVRMVDSPRMTHAAYTLGSASYLAPEQARGSDVGPAADVYALGLVLLEALTGVRAFDGPIHEAVSARLTSAPHIPATLPPPWPALLAAMTALDPAARPSAGEVARVLGTDRPIAYPAPASATAATAVQRTAVHPVPSGVAPVPTDDTGRRRLPWILLATAAALAVAGLIAFLVWGPTASQAPSPSVTNSPSPHTSATPSPTSHAATTHSTSAPPTTHSPSSSPSTTNSPTTSPSSTQPSSPSTSRSTSASSSAPPSSPSTSTSGGAADGPPTSPVPSQPSASPDTTP